jgi:hypothetical protein
MIERWHQGRALWLLASSKFFFTGFALANSCSELVRVREKGLEWVPGVTVMCSFVAKW